MSEELKWVVTADDKDIIAAFKRMQKELENAKKKQAEYNEEAAKGGQKQKSVIDQSLAGLGKMAAAVISVGTAWQVATAEYQHYLDVQNKAKEATIDVANAQIVFMRNMGNMTAEQARRIQDTVTKVAAANKTTESRIYAIATEAVSSKGSLTDEQMFANIGMASRLAPESQQEAVAIAGALNASTRLTGSADPRVNAGLLLGIGEQARIPSMAKIAETLIPSAAGMKATLPGTSTEEAAALFSTLSMISEDKTGSVTGTASLQLAAQLRGLRKGTDLGDEIAKLQNDPKAREAFLKKASFEQKTRPFIEQILTGGSAAAQLYQSNLAKVPTGQTAVGVTDRFFGNVGQSPYQQVAGLDRAMAAATNSEQLKNQSGAIESVVRSRIDEALQGNTSYFGTMVYARGYDIQRARGVDPITAGEQVIGGRLAKARNPDFGAPDNQVIKFLEQQLAELRALRLQSQEQSRPKKKNIDRNTE